MKATASPGQVALTWTASTDTLSGVQGYTVYRNNVVMAETAGPSYTDTTHAVIKIYSRHGIK